MSHTFRVVQGAPVEVAGLPTDPVQFQRDCVDAFVTSRVVRGFSAVTIENESGVLDRMLAALAKPVWEATADDVDRVVGAMAADGLAASTRRGYVQALSSFHRFLVTRRAGEIEALFGVRLVNPIDEFNASRHVGIDSAQQLPPPSVERVAAFFDFLKARIGTARKYAPAARDYALFRVLYHAGLRADEASKLEIADVHFGRGPFGKLHVRFGKGARTSGPRPRWVPMLDHLDLVLRWYLNDVRGKLPESAVLFCDQSGGVMARGTIRNRLRHLQDLEQCPPEDRFSPHALRRACATHNYERGVDLVAIQQILGHWTVGSTMRYVRPSETFIEDAYRGAISGTLEMLQGDGDAH
ncbi:tyrosine-type recombinase/integrase [Rhodococcus pyridinivorans]|uniref:tyrosine-type recombinase/integrase n=1 Tax=Rhodococcus pyridinivorans TaxID=103816 RepID=UPI001E554899|nr:tyrosine-type recombinase/integrase [Rhodococcus pyridinivorans]MCD5422482.1 tyrosine-type recombinase/integrase [Rhodococcus pyridinivorans]